MINVRPTTLSDFKQINLTTTNAYDQETRDSIKNDDYGECVLANAQCCLTFEENCVIIGIVGFNSDGLFAEVFSYLSQEFCSTFNIKIARFVRHLVDDLLEKHEVGVFLIREESEVARKFAEFLGCKVIGKRDSDLVYIKCKTIKTYHE